MSGNAILSALRRMGYAKDEMSGHGFRRMASTLLNEQGWNRDAIERQLAHGERNSVRAAYNYAEFMPERKKMMQAWADCLDGREYSKFCVTVYTSQPTTWVSGSRSQLREWAYNHARRRSWLLLERVCEDLRCH